MMGAVLAISDPDEIAEIIRQKEQGLSCREIGDLHFVSYGTIRNILKRNNASTKKHAPKNIPMIMHDWNAMIQPEKIARIYGFASVDSLHSSVFHYRKSGWKFNYRTKRNHIAKAVAAT